MVVAEQPEANDVAFNTFIGVLVSVCGNALISVALNVQKRAHNNIQERQMANYFANMDEPPQWISTAHYNGFLPDDGYSSPRSSLEQQNRSEAELIEHQKFIMTMAQEQTKSGDTEYLKSKLWWLGISLMILGEVGNFVAYGFAPASTIAPLGTTTLVANVILAPLMLKEVFRKRDLIGVILAVSGAAMVVFSSNSEEVALSPELIMESITQMQSIIYFILTGVAIVALTVLSPIYGASSIMIDLGLVAIYGGYTVLSTKSVASLLSLTFFKMFAYPVSYLLIFVLVVTAVLQIKYLNKALQRFDSTEVIPTQFVLFTVSAIIGSAVLYHDFDDMGMEQMSRFMSGCAIEFLGVYLITSKRTKSSNSPALSISADSGTAISFSDEEALDRVNMLPSDHIANNRKRTANTLTSSGATSFARSTHSNNPASFEAWQEANPHITISGTTGIGSGHAHHGHRRQSSVFRGISMASQLLDRNDEQQPSGGGGSANGGGAIQLPISSSPNTNSIFNHHRRRDSALGNIINGITSAISSHTHTNDPASLSAEDADAVEIEYPHLLHSNHSENTSLDRELMPISTINSNNTIGNTKKSTKLVDIEEQSSEEERDLS
ncbi:peroxiredoxin type-2 [Mucor velutinosus]|uniref:Peroxiredoxin type-2 n=1 Tax=Mucor velutinosus TaxID=708070 RepID=A0AAN7I1Z4_9FUNG|nr:peroxiredoxin type-2 [Mucor velutinosus]